MNALTDMKKLLPVVLKSAASTVITASNTPDGISIKASNPVFNLEKALATDWLGNDYFLTAIFNAMSISFPSGEREFINSVRHYEERMTDEKLLKEIRGFYRQEGVHSREHRKYNKLLCEQRGYDLKALEGVYLNRWAKMKKLRMIIPRRLLAATVAIEHFTASMAEIILTGPMFDHAEPTVRRLWMWHAMEELEHKSVAYDVYTQLDGKYAMRVWSMRITMFLFFIDTLRVAAKMLRHDKQLWRWKTLKSFSVFVFGKSGFVRQYVPAYKDFFRENFHPWDIDSRELLVHWRKNFTPLYG